NQADILSDMAASFAAQGWASAASAGMRRSGQAPVDYTAAETDRAIVKDHGLAGSDGALRRGECDLCCPGRNLPNSAGLVGLSIAHLGRAGVWQGRRSARYPVQLAGEQGRVVERRVMLSLFDVQDVVIDILVRPMV
ncbi:MAG: hypothetical protein H6R46_1467, partial [Proteobacteria bacterium]|nr:hypothetical protein [Pseudomonadota bacterium]